MKRAMVVLGASLGGLLPVPLGQAMAAGGGAPDGGARAQWSAARCVAVDELRERDTGPGGPVGYWTAARLRESVGFSEALAAAAVRSSGGRAATGGMRAQCAPAPGRSGYLARSEPAASIAAARGSTPASRTIIGYRPVGKFFFTVLSLKLNCTGTVISDRRANPKRELFVTAAHCFEGVVGTTRYSTSNWVFAPMWHDNRFPFGKWAVRKAYIDSRWIACRSGKCLENPRYDYAVAVLKPRHGHGVGWYTGQDGWRVNKPRAIKVAIMGIAAAGRRPLINVTISHTRTISGFLARMARTPRFGDGTSGGPWFCSLNAHTQRGNLLGVTGGFQNGGASASPSYASWWGPRFAALVALAARHE